MPTLARDHLIEFGTALLAAGGVGGDEAAIVARSLVGANLRGHDSHGVMRIPYYLEQCDKQEIVPGGPFTVISQTGAALVADGHWGFGQVHAARLTRLLIEKARAGAVAVGTLRRSGHIGRLGEYCELAAEAGLVSIVMVNTHGHARRVAPPGGTEPRLGTNPLAFGVPNADGALVLDFGTSATAEGKVRVKRIAGQQCPPGWLLDNAGRPTTDPNSLYANPPGTILPMGGDQAYKGFGLGLMVEIFAGALSGGVCIRETPINQNGNCVFMLLLNPAGLGGAQHFADEVSRLADFVRSCPTVDASGQILLPGDPERRLLKERTAAGIPLEEQNWLQLVKLAERLKVHVPETSAAAK